MDGIVEVAAALSHAAQELRQCGCGLCRLFRREASEQSAPLTRDMRGRITVDLKDVVIEEGLPHLSLWARQVGDRNRPMKKAEERCAQGSTCTVPPIVDQHVERRQGSNRVPPHIGNEYGIAGLKFSDLSRSGRQLEARIAREVGVVDIDQADRHTLRGEFEGSDIEIFQL